MPKFCGFILIQTKMDVFIPQNIIGTSDCVDCICEVMSMVGVDCAAAAAVFAKDFGEVEEQDAPSPRYNCPMVDIDFYGHDVDHFHGIPNWQECGK